MVMPFPLSFSLRTKLYALVAVAMLAIAVLAGMTFYSTKSSTESLRLVYEENVVPLDRLRTIDDDLQEIRFRIASVVTDQMGAPVARRHLAEVRQNIPRNWAEYRQGAGVGVDPKQRELTDKLDAGLAGLTKLYAKLDEAYGASNDKERLLAFLEDEWPPVITQVSKPIDALIALRTKEVESVYRAAEANEQQLNRIVGGLAVGALVLLVFCAGLIIRAITASVGAIKRALEQVAGGDLTAQAPVSGNDELGDMARAINNSLSSLRQTLNEVRRGADQVAGASGAVKNCAADLYRHSEGQADEVRGMGAAMEELTVSVTQISGGCSQVSAAASRAQTAVERGTSLMAESSSASKRVQAAAARAHAAVEDLSASLPQINAISSVIREIADQTNLLALNAAIEAARAGEQGRGFAVVADEVRKLAERTGSSTAEIAALVQRIEELAVNAVAAMNEVDGDVVAGTGNMERLESALQEILGAACEVAGLAEEIAAATGEQQAVTEQTAKAMEAICQTAEQTNATIAGMAEAADTSAGAVEFLGRQVGRFRTT